ncbi:MAG: PaaI family thioesterase [Deltaproteobacteria bacterium]|nr:PaaI family thioesterase [Deltaproteobacteria bacterium]
MKKIEDYIPLPNGGSHNCFACSPRNPYGLKMKFYTDRESVFSRVIVPDHLSGYTNVVHGGITSTLLDEIMGWASIYLLKKITVTKTMTIDIMKAVHVGEPLCLEASVLGLEGKREALVEGRLFNNAEELCAKSRGRFTLLTPKLAERLNVMSKEDQIEFLDPLLKI